MANSQADPRMVKAEYRDGKLVITFVNGRVAEVPLAELVPFLLRSLDLKRVDVADDGFTLAIPIRFLQLHLRCNTILGIADPEFKKRAEEAATEQLREMGSVFRRMREKKGWDVEELAQKADLDPELIQGIESGLWQFSARIFNILTNALGEDKSSEPPN
jgi:hypothetical protein